MPYRTIVSLPITKRRPDRDRHGRRGKAFSVAVPASQLYDVERYTRMYYDLSINIEGIDAIHHLLGRVESLQQEVNRLKSKLRLYETENHDSIEDL